MKTRHFGLCVLPVLLACGSEPPVKAPAPPASSPASSPAVSTAAAPAKPPPEKVADNTPRATAAGTTFVVPAGWSVDGDPARTILLGPEPDLRMIIVDSADKDPAAAVAASWPLLRAGFKRPIKLVTPLPGRRGWQERREFEYETSPNEKLIVHARALRHGDSWVVVAIEAGNASAEKRIAALRLVLESLRPKGFQKESFAGKTAHKLDGDRLKQIAEFVERGRKALSIPGVAVGVVQDGKVVMAEGFGVKQLGKPDKVTADTSFMIASNTKALVTLLLATEVDQGKFTWETPVTQVYPQFKLGNADTTSKVLMKHLVCACTGVPRQDLEWIFEYKNATPASAMQLLGTMQPTTKFGEAFQYSNLMASAAGFVGGYVMYPKKELGAAFDEAMKKQVFDPLKMANTTFDFNRALKGNHALPHGDTMDGGKAVASMDLNRSIFPARPAGGAWSTTRDLLKYVQMELDKGKLPGGKTLLKESCLMERRLPQISLGQNKSYGMALMVDADYGVTMVHHGGDMIGYHSDMFWIPEANAGGVILTNADGGSALRGPFVRRVMEVLYDGAPEATEDVEAAARQRAAELAKIVERLVVPPAPEATAKLAAHYKCPELGEIHVKADGAARVFDFGEWKSAMASRKNDDGTLSMISVDPGVGPDGFEFVITERGGKKALVLRDMQHEYEFIETP